MAKNTAETPMMKQFNDFKRQYPDAILLFRCGDFYETYCADAVIASEILGITLTKRSNATPNATEMAGFPHHALDTYLPKLVRAGLRVAICDQLEDPKLTKKLVKRGVTELVTPGVSYSDTVLETKENNFVACVHFSKQSVGAAFLDISTGEFLAAEGNSDYIDKLLNNFAPKEVLFERNHRNDFESSFGQKFFTYTLDDWMFTSEAAHDRLTKQFETKNLKGFGVDKIPNGVIAAGAILHYLDMTQHLQTGHISCLSRIEEDRYVWLDKFTVRNLELYGTYNEGAKTLVDIIDRTISPMGSRMLRRWVAFPLKHIKPIQDRQGVVRSLLETPEAMQTLAQALGQIGDLERLISKVAVNRINPREMVQLHYALESIQPIRELCNNLDNTHLKHIAEQLNPCPLISERIAREINENPPAMLNKNGIIRNGVDAELDELRMLSTSSKDYLLQLQQREIENTGISSLRIGFNNVFGYYMEVRNTHKDKVPEEWIRKQTLVNAERYITQELKEYEEKILGAEDRISSIEFRIYNDLVQALNDYVPAIQTNATLLAQLDCLLSFALVSEANHYTCPIIDESFVLDIKNGRHPVIEKQLPTGETYIANDVFLDSDSQQIIIITGPNMAGKSALLRQTALIVLMAQMGCFVPADSARIGLIDKVFTRVGANDNISVGESTFMVEMNEAASILNNLSERSLVLFDELGRGTSTYDGISIAWSIVEYIHEHRGHAKTLFATHYHELNEMEQSFKRIRNYNVSVKEINQKIIFLRKLVRGGSEHSFGIHVAKMAGMPISITRRAEQILSELEKGTKKGEVNKPIGHIADHREGMQLSFFQLEDPVLEQIRDEIKNLDINNLTPIEALNKLNEIKRITTGK